MADRNKAHPQNDFKDETSGKTKIFIVSKQVYLLNKAGSFNLELYGVTATTRKLALVNRCPQIVNYGRVTDHLLTYENTTRELRRQKWVKLTVTQYPNEKNKKARCEQLIAQAFGKELVWQHATRTPMDEARLQATTDKQNEEKLIQKIEKLNEPSLVEADSDKVEGFNTTPRVLGHSNELKGNQYGGGPSSNRKINVTLTIDKEAFLKQTARSKLKHDFGDDKATFSSDVSKENRQPGHRGTPDLDLEELAKRCLDVPTASIDRRILKEMEKLGIPQTGQKSTLDENVVESDLVQNIDTSMRKPRKRIEKLDKEVDLETRQIEKGALAFRSLCGNLNRPILYLRNITKHLINPFKVKSPQSSTIINTCNYCSSSVMRGTMGPTDVNLRPKPKEDIKVNIGVKAEMLKTNIARIGPLPLPKDAIEDSKLFEAKQEAQIQPEVGKCGDKPPPCPPPAPKCPPPAPKCPKKPKCPPKKVECPPKKVECPPPLPPKPCPPPCPKKCNFESLECKDADTVQSLVTSFQKHCLNFDKVILIAHRTKPLKSFAKHISDIVYAREFEPWIPIPSWPYPQKYVRRPVQCPKEGCPTPRPPKDGDFCKPLQKPCTGFPKRATISPTPHIPLQFKIIDIGEF